MSDIKLRIEINNKKPVDLLYLTDSLISLANEYRRYVQSRGLKYNKEARLYVKEIKSGSIITELTDLLPVGMAIIENGSTIIGFVKFIKEVYDYFGKNEGAAPEPLEKTTYENLHNILSPVVQDSGAQINITAESIVTGDIHYHFHASSVESNAAQNRLKEEIKNLETTDATVKKEVIMYLSQATNNTSIAGDKGVIESITTKPLKLLWAEGIKEMILNDNTNPFKSTYLVDCEVHTAREEPVAYKITKIHETIE